MLFVHCSPQLLCAAPRRQSPAAEHTVVCGLEQQCQWLLVQSPGATGLQPSSFLGAFVPNAFILPTAFGKGMVAESHETQRGAKQLMKMLWVATGSILSPPAVVVNDKRSPQNCQVFLAAMIVCGERDISGFITIGASYVPYFPVCTNH